MEKNIKRFKIRLAESGYFDQYVCNTLSDFTKCPELIQNFLSWNGRVAQNRKGTQEIEDGSAPTMHALQTDTQGKVVALPQTLWILALPFNIWVTLRGYYHP